MKNQLLIISIWTTVLASTACCGHLPNKSDANTATRSPAESKRNTIPADAESAAMDKVELTKIYSKAISNYIAAIFQKDKIVFDTLFLGKRENGQPDDFPDIELPKIIHGARVLLLTQKETDENKKLYRKASPYINLIGWVDQDKAAFTFVTFFPEFQHQYDCYINYKYNTATKEYDLEQSRIEVLMLGKDGKPDHFALYEEGKHIGDKPIN